MELPAVTRQHPVMRWLDRARGVLERRLERGRTTRARRLEALGQLTEATLAFIEAGANDEASRVLVVRASAAPAPLDRAHLLAQAADLAAPDAAKALRRRRARLLLDLARDGDVAFARSELCELGTELESLDEPAFAAQAFELAGDAEGQARALVQAGAVERLEQVLDAEREQSRVEAERRQAAARFADLVESGQRKQALELGGRLLSSGGREDSRLEARVRELESRRVRGPRLRIEVDGTLLDLVLGRVVTIGRSDASIVVAAPALSRTHLEIRRDDAGVAVVDLDSRNGTLLAGARLSAPVFVGAGLSLLLGGEIPLSLAPWGAGGVTLELAGETIALPLEPLLVGSWRIELGRDNWIEADLGAAPAVLSGSQVSGSVQLLHGDTLATVADGAPRVTVL
jgi:hypothetical protein